MKTELPPVEFRELDASDPEWVHFAAKLKMTPEEAHGMEAVKKAAILHREISDLDAQLKAVKAKLSKLEPWVLSYFSEVGIDRVTVDALGTPLTLSPRRELWAGPAEGYSADDVADAMAAAGMTARQIAAVITTKCNTSTLSALVREFDRSDSGVPPELAKAIKVAEVFKLSFRAA